MEIELFNKQIKFELSLENLVYAVIGLTSFIWIWFYAFYVMCHMFGKGMINDTRIKIEVVENGE